MRAFLYSVAVAVVLAAGVCAGADVESMIVAGRTALDDGFTDIAIQQLELAVDKTKRDDARNEEAAGLLMRAFQEKEQWGRILDVTKSWRVKGDSPAMIYWRSKALYELGKYGDALEGIRSAGEAKFPAGYARLARVLEAWCLIRLKKADEAFVLFAKHEGDFAAEGERSGYLLEWARALDAAGRPDEAIAILAKVDAAGTSRVALDARLLQAKLLLSARRVEESATMLKSMCADTNAPENVRAEGWILLGRTHEARTNMTDAVAAFSNAVTFARTPQLKHRGAVALGSCFLDMGRLDDGIGVLKPAIAGMPMDPLSESAQMKVGLKLLEFGRAAAAADEFRYHIETFTNAAGQARAHEGMGWALSQQGRHAEAAATFVKAYSLFEDVSGRERTLFKAGDAYFANGQYQIAGDTYRKFLKEFPQSEFAPRALFQLAESVARGDQAEKAEELFREIPTRYPGSPLVEEARLRIAELRAKAGRAAEAMQAYDEVLSVHSNGQFRAEALKGRGLLLYQQFRVNEALKDFEAVSKLSTNGAPAEESMYMTGLCKYSMGRDDEAVAVFQGFLTRNPGSKWAPDALFWLGSNDFNQGRFGQAETNFIRFAETYKGNALADDALLWAARAAARQRQYLRAHDTIVRMMKEYPSSERTPDGRFLQAEALMELGRLSEAILACDEIIHKYPTNALVASAWVSKGDCQFNLGTDANTKPYEESIHSYTVASGITAADPDLVCESQFKIGRSLEKMRQSKRAFEQYYLKVIVPFLEDKEKGAWRGDRARVWFVRAALNAADIMEREKNWKGAVNVLQRVVDSGVREAQELKERIRRIKAEHGGFFE